MKNKNAPLSLAELGVSVLNSQIDGLLSLKTVFNDNFNNIVQKLAHVGGKVIFCGIGKSFLIASKISSTMSSLGTPSFCMHASEGPHGDFGMISKNDFVVFVSNSGETLELVPCVGFCKNLGVDTLAITLNQFSFLANECKYNLTLPKHGEGYFLNPPITSAAMTIAIGDIIAICVSSVKNFTTTDYAKLHPFGSIGLNSTTAIEFFNNTNNDNTICSINDTISDVITKLQTSSVVTILDNDGMIVGFFNNATLQKYALSIVSGKHNLKLADAIDQTHQTVPQSAFMIEVVKKMQSDKSLQHIFIIGEKQKFHGVISRSDLLVWL